MKRYLIYALLFFPALILANSYSVQIQFPFPREGFSSSALYEQGYGFYIAPGALQLPVKQINILLPKDAIVNDWQLTFDPDITFKGEAPIFNSAFTNGEEILGAPIKRNNPSRYNFLGLRKWGDLNYASFYVIPGIYDGSNWLWNSSCRIDINYSASAKQNGKIPPTFQKRDFFANPQCLINWYEASKEPNNRLLVITTPSLYTALNDLVLFRQTQGIDVNFCDIATALASGTGTDNAEKLRNYLQNTYNQNPFSYLLLVGDDVTIPTAYVTPEPNGLETVATDFFYSDLSSNWDTDSDGLRGEYSTGYLNEDYGIDFTPEVFVGRISTNYASEVSAIANRIVAYEQSTEPWKDKNLLSAAFLNYQGEPEIIYPQTDGGLFMEFLRNTCLVGQDNFTMYEQEGVIPSFPSDLPANYNNLLNALNNESWGFINWSAHGSAIHSSRKVWSIDYNNNNIPDTYEMNWMPLVDCQSFDDLENQDGTVIFAASCYNGYMDYYDTCLSEYALIKKAVGVLAATRTGWYKIGWLNPGWGGLSSYNYHFVENFRNNKLDLGSAHSWANLLHTQYYLFGDPIDSEGIIYPELQNVYTYMLFGDPMIGWALEETDLDGEILVWEPEGNAGLEVVNALREIRNFNVIYTDKLIPEYSYLHNFEAVIYLAANSVASSSLDPDSYEYEYLNSYLDSGGKLYCENYIDFSFGELYNKMGAQLDNPVNLNTIYHPESNISWNYSNADSTVYALIPIQPNAQGIFISGDGETDNSIVGILNSTDDYSVITSSFQLSRILSGEHNLPDLMEIILAELNVTNSNPDSNNEQIICPTVQSVSVYPNPASQNSQLHFQMRKATPISISIFNIKGQKVKTLINNELKEGEYHLSWDGKDNNGRTCSSGVYYYQIAAPNQNITKKMLLLK